MNRDEFNDRHRRRDPEDWEELYRAAERDLASYDDRTPHQLLDRMDPVVEPINDSDGWPGCGDGDMEGTFVDSDGRTMALADMLWQAKVARGEVALLEHMWGLPCPE